MGPAKSISSFLATLLLLSAFSVASSFGHLEEHSLNPGHIHAHSDGTTHSHKHGSDTGHHTVKPTPLLPAKQRQFLLAPEHRFAGDGPIFSHTLLPGYFFESPTRTFSLAVTDSLEFSSVFHSALHSGRAPPLHIS